MMAATAREPWAVSLHIGLDAVDPRAYAGWEGPLAAAEVDARALAGMAAVAGWRPIALLGARATRRAVLDHVRAASEALHAGDSFWISFAGHGGQVPDLNGDEPDRWDETWCLFDGQLIDDELTLAWRRFRAGVRVLVVTDCCHGGTVTRATPPSDARWPGPLRTRFMPVAVARRTYEQHRAFYDQLQGTDPEAALDRVAVPPVATPLPTHFAAQVIMLVGCTDSQSACETDDHGLFTDTLLRVWNQGRFSGDYRRLQTLVRARMPAWQSPYLRTLGDAVGFLRHRPFAPRPPGC
jgi:hypothetical protein